MTIVCCRRSFNVVIMIIACQIVEYNKREPVSIYLPLVYFDHFSLPGHFD